MQIHVVQSGQTLFGIAQAYDSNVAEIVRANELPVPDELVVGQALVIPIVGSFYWVRQGDTLYTIGQRFNISAAALARTNRIPMFQPLQIGLRLYIPPRPRRTAEFFAYVEPRRDRVPPALEEDARKAAPVLTYLAPSSFRINRDGTLTPPLLNNFPTIARENNTVLSMVITNLEEAQFSTELGRIVLNDETVQNRLLDTIFNTAEQLGFRDIHFDMEKLRGEDREAYNQFLRRTKRRAEQAGYILSVAVAPKTSAEQPGVWYTAHDYEEIGKIADFVVIMTYEWGYSGGPPLPVSPIRSVRRVLDYAITEMPANKIMMGQNLYGYDWTLPYQPGTTARAVSSQRAIDIARREKVNIQYDYRDQAPFFEYVDDAGRTHRVWFEDARSIQAKFDLVKELGLRGVSYWKLGLPFPQNWLLIENNFRVVKKT